MALVSVSRRTDIPAFYGDWFINRLKAGFCLVRNPFRRDQVRRIELTPQAVDGLIFWTRRPAPFFKHLDLLRPFPFYFQMTLTAMPRPLEPHLPPEEELVKQFLALSQRIGPERLVWRFDPLVVTPLTPPEEIKDRFKRLSRSLAGRTGRVVISLVHLYPKVRRRMGSSAELKPMDLKSEPALARDLLGRLGEFGRRSGLKMTICASEEDFGSLGFSPGRCIDPAIINRAYGLDLDPPRDRGQRPACGCAESIDIGAYDSCLHGCVYCYANRSRRAAGMGFERHDPEGGELIGRAG